jgi:hypothetical protein
MPPKKPIGPGNKVDFAIESPPICVILRIFLNQHYFLHHFCVNFIRNFEKSVVSTKQRPKTPNYEQPNLFRTAGAHW